MTDMKYHGDHKGSILALVAVQMSDYTDCDGEWEIKISFTDKWRFHLYGGDSFGYEADWEAESLEELMKVIADPKFAEGNA